MASGPVLQMPLHLLSIVLSQLDAMPSLASAIFSHSSFYAAFDEDRDRIVRSILRNQIPHEIRRYAFPAYLAATTDLRHRGKREIRFLLLDDSVEDYEFRRSMLYREITAVFDQSGPANIDLANMVSRTHTMIEHFARDFIRDTLPLGDKELGLQRKDKTAASSDEVYRIHRAMYRYVRYCNLFRRSYNTRLAGKLGSSITIFFFQRFAPWVNEQLACVHDYFERVLSRAFDEVAAHDVEWGCKSISWRTVADQNQHKQGYLLRGLKFLYQLQQATTYGERRQILGDSVPRTKNMLGTTLGGYGSTVSGWPDWDYFWDHIDTTLPNGAYSVNYEWNSNGPDVYGSAPFRIWRASHEDCWRQDVIAHADHTWLRRCGYVFWDFSEATVTDDQLKLIISRARQKAWLDRFRRNDGELKRKMKRSRKERAEIYKRGGRGYWSEGDLSQIVWTEGAPR
ncbi:uncharacterized protein B0H64DRAFT_1269 [Chaetomium fimeti]|uniref:F-box domain-containing protein n=1 Tax=Chaetomium fimeti TaxID=1854472 RepID=A0AAE0HNF6_9PEZI|nr:hypothetical protein B0H64DRAFT_1269 [Chaetomium fimeti]